MFKRFNGKVMLFGEYALLEGGHALTTPFSGFSGILQFEANISKEMESHQSVLAFSKSLISGFSQFIQIEKLEADLVNRLFFKANIPQGYGVGSSAALVAALLAAYGKNVPASLPEKKQLFGEVESYFHGKSSGLDVLASFENRALVLDADGAINAIDLPQTSSFQVHLIDSNQIGITSDLVNHFRLLDSEFKSLFRSEYVSATNLALAAFLANNKETLFNQVKQLSQFTLKHMAFAIPDNQKEMWANGLETGQYFMKLCGSGGGGFALCFCDEKPPIDSVRII